MNKAIKLTITRIILAFLIIFILLFPFYSIGFEFPRFLISGVPMDSKYFVAGALFTIAAITDFIDGYIARKKHLVTDSGKMLDAIADKVLVDSVLIVFASVGFISAIIPVIIVVRDIFVNAIKMEAAIKGKVISSISSGKIKTASLMLGIIFMFFYNMPFELWNIRVDLFLLYFATIMAILSMIEYYQVNKEIIFPKKKIVNS